MTEDRLMRTSMYAGGTSPVKMIQAGFYNEDCLVYDLEDSVSAGEKDAARLLVYHAVKYQRPRGKYILIRVNGIYSEEIDEDLEAAVRAQPDAIRIPKVEYAKEVRRIDARITEINVNILTGSSGEMMGGLGGGPDVAGGAAVSIVTIPIIRGRTPSIVKKVFTLCTPGETVAAVVTEAGIALNPRHRSYGELREDLSQTGLKLTTIEELQQLAESMTGVPKPIETTDRVTCIVEYRDGTVIDVIRQVKR